MENENENENVENNFSLNDIKLKKKRGRKPKNTVIEENIVVEKKKRGRKKKYEIENFDKIINRECVNNFNHDIVYSDDEENNNNVKEDVNSKSISFGNLNIMVSKKNKLPETNTNIYKGLLSTKKNVILQKIKNI